jgi:hypothetical protein
VQGDYFDSGFGSGFEEDGGGAGEGGADLAGSVEEGVPLSAGFVSLFSVFSPPDLFLNLSE